ncbi:MAG TPA: MBL fold metallo-hydrolase [Thermoanaerobaculia bacterium]|nr:MBL fold metallo-hydrolase [Thermoanaerobaculia bacterium]
MLGTGTPVPDPERSGPAVAIVVAGRVYLVDAGAGVIRRAAAAVEAGEWALLPENLDRLFVTHLHSDHTIGIPDVLHMGWIQGRVEPLEIYGPPGIAEMSRHLEQAWSADVEVRRRGAEDRLGEGYRIDAVEIEPGVVYQDERVRVTAFAVEHGSWEHAFGYRFDTADRSIVVSGDAAPSESVVDACDGCDLLIHEVYSAAAFSLLGPGSQGYHSTFHTSTEELADLAKRARARKLVLYHQLYFGADDEMLIEEMRRAGFEGELESARDLGVY